MKTELKKNITDTFMQLKNVLDDLSPEQLNTLPFTGSWTAGQVTEHIIKSLSGIELLMQGPSTTIERDPAEKVKGIEDLFLDRTNKFQSPDFILPGPGPFDKFTQSSALEKAKNELLDAVDLDLSQEAGAAELPGFGKLTREEWIHFFLAHTIRHTRQLKKIAQTFNNPA